MLNLEPNSGLPISLQEDGFLEFRPPLGAVQPEDRKIFDMKDYLADQNASFPTNDVYLMYRGIAFDQDREIFKNAHLSYDVAVFRPGLLGREFCKTIGHRHAKKPGTDVRFPEVYEVLSGQALFLIQKIDEVTEQITEAYIIQAGKGEKVVFPPGFGHITINAQPKTLVTANWDETTPSDYDFYKKHRGGAYYVLQSEGENIKIVPNPSYKNPPPLINLRPKDLSQFGLIKDVPMYQTGQNSLDMLQFMTSPELYLDKLTISNCYSISNSPF